MMTREEIRAVYDQGQEAVIALVEQLYVLIAQHQEQIAQLQGRVKELEDRFATTSRASHKPPSSDGLVKQRRSLREPSTCESGGQPGHRGATLEPVAEPDQTLLHEPLQCTSCGRVLSEVAGRLWGGAAAGL
jgi:transposase